MRPEGMPRGGSIALDDVTLAALRLWVRNQFGLCFAGDQEPLLRTRLEDFCAAQQVSPQALLLGLTAGQQSLVVRLAEAVSTNHTFFFREPETFAFLCQTIVPSLVGREVRIWSAAASSGDEAYSIAMAAHECLGPPAENLVRVLGTDLSERQVQSAERGLYSIHQMAALGSERKGRWFVPVGQSSFQAIPKLRSMCTFRRMNLTARPWPFEQRFHVIFLRNVLYYFEPRVRRDVVEACFDAAEPGAWLVTSLTEPMVDLVTRWTPVGPALFRRGPG
jgi:chemotaxis protein methyltransferase CheR